MTSDITQALSRIPSGRFLLTAAHDGARSAILVTWVQPCAADSPLVMTALATSRPVTPLIRDSRGFALCQIAADDRFLSRKFATTPVQGEDPFVGLDTFTAASGAPIVSRAMSYLDCELVRHVDLEADCGLYVGLVRAGGVLNDGAPEVVIGGKE
jgi:flavin reductase (DIM6/NTAB) family NADH-FMN oxidoreductase RutF